jgi:hypothetical protein
MQSASMKDKRALDTKMAKLELKVSQLTDETTNLQQVSANFNAWTNH